MTVDSLMDWVNKALTDVSASGIVAEPGLVRLSVSVSGSFTGEGSGFDTPHYPDHWANIASASLFSERVGLPAWVDNDSNAVTPRRWPIASTASGAGPPASA